MRIFGIDPGTAIIGWAIVEIKEKTGENVAVAYGHITTSKKKTTAERLTEANKKIEKIIKKYKPQEAAIEDIFFFKNLKTAIKVSQARGAILLTLERFHIKIAEYTPLQVKQAVTGYGRAEKGQIQVMVKQIFKLREIPSPDDVADALAVAMCHLSSRKMKAIKEFRH